MYLLQNRKTFAYSAENPTGTRNGGTRGKDCEKLRPCVQIKPGETVTLCDDEGPGMITHMWIGGYSGHSFILRIYWEGSDQPSVEAPLSAFFGCAYDENFETVDGEYPYLNSALLLVTPAKGLNCYFEMPYRKRCKITMENRGISAGDCYYMITGWHGELPENISYFHAAYRQEHPVQKGRSYLVADIPQGKGRFLGVTLASGVNGHNTCWVEGEAKMYIDGEDYPSLSYTGTEDYFCGSYAFGNDNVLHKYQTFSGLYAGMFAIFGNTKDMYNAQKRFLLYRFHVTDAVYFDQSFRMTLDDLGWTGARYDDFTSVAYWYLDEPRPLAFTLPEDREIVMK